MTQDMPQLKFNGTIKDRFEVIQRFIEPSKSVLDVGVVDSRRQKAQTSSRLSEKNPTMLFRKICEANPNAMGVDIDEGGIELLKSQGFNVKADDAMTMRLDKQFDTIVAGELIEHLENPGQFLRNVGAHLKPGGVFMVSTPNPFYIKQVWKIWRHNGPQVHEEHTCWFDPMTLGQLLKMTGFEIDAIYWVQPEQMLLKTWPRFLRSYFSHSFMIVARTKKTES